MEEVKENDVRHIKRDRKKKGLKKRIKYEKKKRKKKEYKLKEEKRDIRRVEKIKV